MPDHPDHRRLRDRGRVRGRHRSGVAARVPGGPSDAVAREPHSGAAGLRAVPPVEQLGLGSSPGRGVQDRGRCLGHLLVQGQRPPARTHPPARRQLVRPLAGLAGRLQGGSNAVCRWRGRSCHSCIVGTTAPRSLKKCKAYATPTSVPSGGHARSRPRRVVARGRSGRHRIRALLVVSDMEPVVAIVMRGLCLPPLVGDFSLLVRGRWACKSAGAHKSPSPKSWPPTQITRQTRVLQQPPEWHRRSWIARISRTLQFCADRGAIGCVGNMGDSNSRAIARRPSAHTPSAQTRQIAQEIAARTEHPPEPILHTLDELIRLPHRAAPRVVEALDSFKARVLHDSDKYYEFCTELHSLLHIASYAGHFAYDSTQRHQILERLNWWISWIAEVHGTYVDIETVPYYERSYREYENNICLARISTRSIEDAFRTIRRDQDFTTQEGNQEVSRAQSALADLSKILDTLGKSHTVRDTSLRAIDFNHLIRTARDNEDDSSFRDIVLDAFRSGRLINCEFQECSFPEMEPSDNNGRDEASGQYKTSPVYATVAFIECVLDKIDWSGLRAYDLLFKGHEGNRMKLTNANLTNATFLEVALRDLHGINLSSSGAVFRNCHFHQSRLESSDFTSAVFLDCAFENFEFAACKLDGSVFHSCKFDNCSFEGGTLWGTTFSESYLLDIRQQRGSYHQAPGTGKPQGELDIDTSYGRLPLQRDLEHIQHSLRASQAAS